jgi:hypothetical protein
MKKSKKPVTKEKGSSKADMLMETYRELGFAPTDPVNGTSAGGSNGAWLAPVSFLPHIDYTISSVVGGF